MERKKQLCLVIIAIVLVAMIGVYYLTSSPSPPSPKYSQVTIKAVDQENASLSASIAIDEVSKGETPLTLNLEYGTYNLTATYQNLKIEKGIEVDQEEQETVITFTIPYGLVTFKATDQFDNALDANVTIGSKEGITPFRLTLRYGSYDVVAKFQNFTVEKTVDINQSIQDVTILFALPVPPQGSLLVRIFHQGEWGYYDHCVVEVFDGRKNYRISDVNSPTSTAIGYGVYNFSIDYSYYVPLFAQFKSVVKNGTIEINSSLQQLRIVVNTETDEITYSFNVLTPPPIETEEITVKLLSDKIGEVRNEEKEGIYNSDLAMWLYSLPGKTIRIRDAKIEYFFPHEETGISLFIYVEVPGEYGWYIWGTIQALGSYSSEKANLKEGDIITFEGEVRAIDCQTIYMTYDQLIEKEG